MASDLQEKLEAIDQIKTEIQRSRPLSQVTLKSIRDDWRLRFTYNSNAIEGNTLTLLETKVIVEDGITVGGKMLREHFEAINHCDAIDYIESIVRGEEALSQFQIRNIHGLILKNIDHDNAGKYRSVNVMISGARHTPPDVVLVAEQMNDLMAWYQKSSKTMHPVLCASELHARFVKIHPFVDGNGRTSRLLMNFELMRNYYLPTIIPIEKRLKYYETLDLAHVEDDVTPFNTLISDCLLESYENYRRFLT